MSLSRRGPAGAAGRAVSVYGLFTERDGPESEHTYKGGVDGALLKKWTEVGPS